MKPMKVPTDRNGNPVGRCCAVCGRMGGSGMNPAIVLLREAGYPLKVPEARHAHGSCVIDAKRKLASKAG
jgi:hypothetical protein